MSCSMVAARLVEQEGKKCERCGGKQAGDQRGVPTGMRTFDDAPCEGRKPDENECLTDGVERAGAGRFGLGHETRGEEYCGDADGDVDPEDGAPADGLSEGSADEGTDAE